MRANHFSLYLLNSKCSLFLIISLIVMACREQPAYIPQNNTDAKNGTSIEGIKNENMGRSSWQKPNLVIEKLGDVSQKTIVDVGAGTGYFTFRMAFKAKKVIAIDIDPNMIALIESFRLNLPQDLQSKVETRLVTANDAMLKEGECDVAVVINTYGYIKNGASYLMKLKKSLNTNAQIMIVDFNKKKLPIGMPNTANISIEQVVSDLTLAGYKDIRVDENTLDYQFIVLAKV
jgi:2-polyprenyl-3-methyl-5-hydroxy-6-metoxy-1,4-benzoquinol methylase